MRKILLNLMLLLPPLLAQTEPQPVLVVPGEDGKLQQIEHVAADTYTPDKSRELFAACDDDGDGTLDLFETAAALDDTISSVRELERFRRLDRNRDGGVDFDEFDRHYREVIRHGGTFRVHPSKRSAAVAADQAWLEQQLLRMFDRDRSGDFSREEAEAVLAAANVPASVSAMLARIDSKVHRRFAAAELLPLLQGCRIPGLPEAPKTGVALQLPATFAALDSNHDGAIDDLELAAALRRCDPSLARWAPLILHAADRDGDGKLTAEELQSSAPTALPAVVDHPARR